jgi:hypothetical protein
VEERGIISCKSSRLDGPINICFYIFDTSLINSEKCEQKRKIMEGGREGVVRF